MTSLVAMDVGGTHARFAEAEVSDGRVVRMGDPVTLRTAEDASFPAAWARYRAQRAGPPVDAVAIAVAGPVDVPLIRFTNNDWTIDPARLDSALGIERHCIVNDFAAVAHAVAQAPADQFTTLCGPDEPLPDIGTISVVGPGTGLGVAHLWRDGADYRVQATEGGHIDFAPIDAFEDRLLVRLRERHRRVSVERVVSGPGIADIYALLAATSGGGAETPDDKNIWTRGLAREDALADSAVDRFCLSLGSVAGDIALAQGAAGVVIAGGVGQRLRDRIGQTGFAMRFQAKGRFERLMAALPVKLITHPQPGLFGAAAAFAREYA